MISLWKYGLWIQNSIVFSLWRSWALSLFFTLLYVIWCLNWCIVWKGSSGLWLFMVMHWISIGNNKCHVPDIKKFQILCSTAVKASEQKWESPNILTVNQSESIVGMQFEQKMRLFSCGESEYFGKSLRSINSLLQIMFLLMFIGNISTEITVLMTSVFIIFSLFG